MLHDIIKLTSEGTNTHGLHIFFQKNSIAFRPVFVSFVKPVCLAMAFFIAD